MPLPRGHAAPAAAAAGGGRFGNSSSSGGHVSFPSWVRGVARGSCNTLFTEQVRVAAEGAVCEGTWWGSECLSPRWQAACPNSAPTLPATTTHKRSPFNRTCWPQQQSSLYGRAGRASAQLSGPALLQLLRQHLTGERVLGGKGSSGHHRKAAPARWLSSAPVERLPRLTHSLHTCRQPDARGAALAAADYWHPSGQPHLSAAVQVGCGGVRT
jgi:hypothetical protein